jgi:hypothetical protein
MNLYYTPNNAAMGFSKRKSSISRRRTIAVRQQPVNMKMFRFAAFLLIILAAFTFGAMVQAFAGDDKQAVSSLQGADEYKIPQAVMITVLPGDTLWDIATAHAPEGAHIPKYIHQIKLLNDLKTSSLSIGQVLQLP